ncbi:MAG: GRP family sugar transporter [Dehalococcoidia bacterium]|nr:GRP family sugar transporter [Dehalococcoidia bacterium]
MRGSPVVAGYIFALFAAFFWGGTHVMIKIGVTSFTTPLAGATVSTMTGALILSSIVARDFNSLFQSRKKAVMFVLIAGMAASLGFGAQFIAFSLAPVTIVSPITASYPVLTAGLAHLFLKKTETVTFKVLLGALSVILGVILITFGRSG